MKTAFRCQIKKKKKKKKEKKKKRAFLWVTLRIISLACSNVFTKPCFSACCHTMVATKCYTVKMTEYHDRKSMRRSEFHLRKKMLTSKFQQKPQRRRYLIRQVAENHSGGIMLPAVYHGNYYDTSIKPVPVWNWGGRRVFQSIRQQCDAWPRCFNSEHNDLNNYITGVEHPSANIVSCGLRNLSADTKAAIKHTLSRTLSWDLFLENDTHTKIDLPNENIVSLSEEFGRKAMELVYSIAWWNGSYIYNQPSNITTSTGIIRYDRNLKEMVCCS